MQNDILLKHHVLPSESLFSYGAYLFWVAAGGDVIFFQFGNSLHCVLGDSYNGWHSQLFSNVRAIGSTMNPFSSSHDSPKINCRLPMWQPRPWVAVARRSHLADQQLAGWVDKRVSSHRFRLLSLFSAWSSARPHTSGPLGVVLIAPYINVKVSLLLNINHEEDGNHWEKGVLGLSYAPCMDTYTNKPDFSYVAVGNLCQDIIRNRFENLDAGAVRRAGVCGSS